MDFPRFTRTVLDVGGPCIEAFGMISESCSRIAGPRGNVKLLRCRLENRWHLPCCCLPHLWLACEVHLLRKTTKILCNHVPVVGQKCFAGAHVSNESFDVRSQFDQAIFLCRCKSNPHSPFPPTVLWFTLRLWDSDGKPITQQFYHSSALCLNQIRHSCH